MRRGGVLLCVLGLIAVGCAATRFTAPPSEPASPVSARGRGLAPASPPSASSAAPLDLSAFRPLLALAEQAPAREKLEQGELEAAAFLVFPKGPVASQHEAALAFVAARLHEQAGAFAEAMTAFALSARVDWALKADAALRAAEMCLRLDKAHEAQIWLDGAVGLEDEPRYLRAQARLLRGNGDRSGAARSFWLAYESEPRLADLFDLAESLLVSEPPTEAAVASRLELSNQLERALRLARVEFEEKAEERKKIDAYLARLPKGEVTPIERLVELEALVQRSRAEEALALADIVERELSLKEGTEVYRCEAKNLKAKALSLLRRWGEAYECLLPVKSRAAVDPALHPKILFNAAKYAAADGRDTAAVKLYAELEQTYPKSSLADDARLRAARSYRDMGAMARYTELLMSMPEDYPDGDMTSEGVLELALHQAQRGDWGAAALVLARGANLVRGRDAARGTEFAGTERYFLARARAETNDVAGALDEYESIVKEVPLSYYMLHAFSRLFAVDPDRARGALSDALARARSSPFSFPAQPEYETPAFRRGLELLRAGDVAEGRRVLSTLGLQEGAADSLVWGIALLYDRAGDAHSAQTVLRGRLTDWLGHYPEGPWRAAWEIGFPRPYHHVVTRASQSTRVSEALIYGVMREESIFDPLAESPARAYGLMQLIEPTARTIGKPLGLPYSKAALFQPKVNIALGSRVLSELLKRFDDRVGLAVPGYNAGPGRPARWLKERPGIDFDLWVEAIPIRETRRYTKRVLASRAAYEFLYGGGDGESALLLPRTLSL